jgi:hypothetical protein
VGDNLVQARSTAGDRAFFGVVEGATDTATINLVEHASLRGVIGGDDPTPCRLKYRVLWSASFIGFSERITNPTRFALLIREAERFDGLRIVIIEYQR